MCEVWFTRVFRYVMLPVAFAWTMLMAYIACIYAVQQTLVAFKGVSWHILLEAGALLGFVCGVFGLFRYMVYKQNLVHKQLFKELIVDDDDDESEVIEL